MDLSVFGRDGSDTGRTVTLDEAVFNTEPNDHAIWLDVKSVQANARQGTHKAKERSEVRGGGRKPWRQKGTGRARVGTIRSPLWIGGGSIFGPRPHKYSVGVNRKTKQLARRSALAYKAREDRIRIVEDFSFDQPSTRELISLLDALQIETRKVVLLTGSPDEVLYKSGRNIPGFRAVSADSVSTVDVLGAHLLLIQESALEVLTRQLGNAVEASEETTEVAE